MGKRLLTLLLCGVLLCGCGMKPEEPEPDMLLEETAVTFADGETASLWQAPHFGSRIYRLADGTELLRCSDPLPVSNVSVGGLAGYDGLSEPVQQAVLAYFEAQGILFDEEGELLRAYEDYRLAERGGREFRPHFLMQDDAPYGENEWYLSCLTLVTEPRDLQYDGLVEDRRLGVIFDKTTGETVPVWELFSIAEDEARKALLDAAAKHYPGERAEVEAAFDERYILWAPDHLEIGFPAGTLPSMENSYICHLEAEELAPILTDKALAGRKTE